MKQNVTPEFEVLEGRCAGPEVCPLSRVKAGAVVCIRQLSTAPEITSRLRELGFCEDQKIKLVARQSNYICQVCNARLAISGKLADSIMVETVPAPVRRTDRRGFDDPGFYAAYPPTADFGRFGRDGDRR